METLLPSSGGFPKETFRSAKIAMAARERRTVRRTALDAENVFAEIMADLDSDEDDNMIPEIDEDEDSNFEVSDESETDENVLENVAPVRPRSVLPANNDSAAWSKVDIQPIINSFTGDSGLKIPVPRNDCAFEWLKIFLSDELVQHITEETNRYAKQFLEDKILSPGSRERNFIEVSVFEMWQYLGILFMTGIDRRPEIEDYWSTRECFHTPWFGRKMSLRRFQQISKFLHFSDNQARPTNCQDRLYKIRPVLNILVSKFKSVYVPKKEISLDEGMMAWKGRLSFRVYMPDKPDRYGVKAYIVCESESGYIWNLEIYSGVAQPIKELVPSLLGNTLLDKNYHLYQDNYYNSVDLSDHLLRRNTYVCGTFRLDRGAPKEFRAEAVKLKKGESIFIRKGQILVQVWRDKRPVKLISTLHTAKLIDSAKKNRQGEVVKKPEIIEDYNQFMQGVDRADQMLHYYPCARKTIKWSKKIVMYLLQMAALNSYILLKKFSTDPKKKAKRYSFKEFLLDCIEFMTNDTTAQDEEDEEQPRACPSKRPPVHDPQTRLEGGFQKHKVICIPATEKKKNPTRTCRVCSKKKTRKETRVMCEQCNVPLCKTPCYILYHTKQYY